MRVLTAKQMRAVDRRTIDDIGLPSLVLMENAGRQVVAALESRIDELSIRRVVALCGTGLAMGAGASSMSTKYKRDSDVASGSTLTGQTVRLTPVK